MQSNKCNKFIPQAFNQNKCQNCFLSKDSHSSEALLEFSKSSRKIIKYGYLFIAPPELDLNKTKRWQWRFFILYDDGELTYALDDNPLTIPQGRINIEKCQEVSDATALTGYPNSLRLNFFDQQNIFIAGSGLDDILKWKDALNAYFERKNASKFNKRLSASHQTHYVHPKDYVDAEPLRQQQQNNNNNTIHNSNSNSNINNNDIKTNNQANPNANTANNNNNNNNCASKLSSNKLMSKSEPYVNTNLNNNNTNANTNSNTNNAQSNTITNNKNTKKTSDQRQMSLSNYSSSNANKNSKQMYRIDDRISFEDEEDIDLGDDEDVELDVDIHGVDVDEHELLMLAEKSQQQQQQQQQAARTETPTKDKRRFSYKEDDLLRKQRLKENLNQLLIEYKHEEERFKKSNTVNNAATQQNYNIYNSLFKNRSSLDSAKMNENFQKITKPINSAFKPINASQTTPNSNSNAASSTKQSKSKQTQNNADDALSASSSYSSTSSSSSSWSSSSSSSNSPPKNRTITNSASQVTASQSNSNIASNQAQQQQTPNSYKHPCLISPRKETPIQQQTQTPDAKQAASNLTDSFLDLNASKSLTILIRNNSADESAVAAAAAAANGQSTNSTPLLLPMSQQKQQLTSSSTSTSLAHNIDYDASKKQPLRRATTQPIVPKIDSKPIRHSNMDMIRTGHLWKWSESQKHWEKYWFSLNSSSLLYWNEKIEQDLGKACLAKIELYKCVLIKEIYSVEFDNYSFQLIYHNASTIFKAITSDVRNNWIQAIHQSIDQSPSQCPKCKPKLIVNPLQTNLSISPAASATSSNSTIINQQAPLTTTTTTFTTSTTNPQPSSTTNTSITITCVNSTPSQSTASRINTENMSDKPSPPIKIESQKDKIDSCHSLKSDCIPERLAPVTQQLQKSQKVNDVDQYEKLLNENNEMKLKYKLLEEIHYDTISEYDKRQNLLYNQIDDMSDKCNQRDQTHENLVEKLKEMQGSYEHNIKTLNEKLSAFESVISAKDNEIGKLKDKLNEVALTQSQKKASGSNTTWNNEVRNLDARINDVLGKIKERELLLNNYDDWERKYKELDKSFGELNQELAKSKIKLSEDCVTIAELRSENDDLRKRVDDMGSKKPSLHDFDDDLAKVLISKEETITQLEKSVQEKDKTIAHITKTLNDELTQTNLRYQELLNSGKEKNNLSIGKLNERIKTLESDNEKKAAEIEHLKEDVDKLNSYIDELEQQMSELRESKLSIEQRYESLNESSRNEIDTLQEEIKTLEYKFAHSQKETNDLRSLLSEGNFGLCRKKSNSSQNVAASEESELKIAQLEKELNEAKEENYELNEHIYALDEFIRDKEAQNDVFEDRLKLLTEEKNGVNEKLIESERLNESMRNELNELRKIINSLKDSQFLDAFVNIFNSDGEKVHEFAKRIAHLLRLLNERARNRTYLHEIDFSDENFVSLFDSTTQLGSVCDANFDSRKMKRSLMVLFKRLKVAQNLLRKQLGKLSEFYSSETTKFNAQLVTYMTEQMVHKAALNGHLKFACELLRKKCSDSMIIIPNGNKLAVNNVNNATSSIKSLSSSQHYQTKSAYGSVGKQSEFDENLSKKLLKITSELLVCDEDSLRKLSGQILNEAEHLDQLNAVINALRKIRTKQFTGLYGELVQAFDKLLEMQESNENLLKTDDYKLDYNENAGDENDDDDSEIIDHESDDCEDEADEAHASQLQLIDNNKAEQLSFILNTITDIYTQHKLQVCDQLNEVHKLMSISSDDELIVHLQSENSRLQQELISVKSSLENYSLKTLTNASNSMSSLQYSPINTPTNRFNCSPFSLNKDRSSANDSKSQMYGQILTDLLSQDDTMC